MKDTVQRQFALRDRPGISRAKRRQQLRRANSWSDLSWRQALVASIARTGYGDNGHVKPKQLWTLASSR